MPNKIYKTELACVYSVHIVYDIRAAGFPAHVGRSQTWPRYMIITIISVLYNICCVYVDQQFDRDSRSISYRYLYDYYKPFNNIIALRAVSY